MKAITVKGLTKKYKEHLAVDHISFEVEKGEFFAFLGENGAGKSTTINMLCTTLMKTEGEAELLGFKLGEEDDEIRKRVGIVFQNSVLDSKLTVKENLLTRASYYGLTKKQAMERLEPFMDSFELREIWDRNYEKLSGGQRRRVDIVRALINKPQILFLDEPTTGLDPKSRQIVWNYIDKLRKTENITLFLTTHYMEETRDANHVVILDKGKIIAQDSPVNLKTKYAKSRLIWYTPQIDDIEKICGGREYEYVADHYNIYFTENISEFVAANKDILKDFEVIKGSMDDVFLNLTGKELGE